VELNEESPVAEPGLAPPCPVVSRCLSLEKLGYSSWVSESGRHLRLLAAGRMNLCRMPYVFQQIADEVPGFPLARQLHFSKRHTENRL
jgi:hypothetical protein